MYFQIDLCLFSKYRAGNGIRLLAERNKTQNMTTNEPFARTPLTQELSEW